MIHATEAVCVFPEYGRMVARLPDDVVPAMQQVPCAATRGNLVELPWTEESCRILENVGIDVLRAAPLCFDALPLVEGKYLPMDHQYKTAAFITLHPRSYVLSDPRTGKTGSLILAADYLQRKGVITGAWLIITTVTTILSVWEDNIRASLPAARIGIAHGDARESVLNEAHDFIITNYDSCRLSCRKFLEAIRFGAIQGVIVDEMTHVGNAASQRHKAIAAITNAAGIKRVVGVTGTPGSDPEVIYGMCKAINKDKLPCKTKTSWMDLTTYRWGMENFQRSLAPNAPDIFHRAMQPSIRYNKADIISLPPVIVQDVHAATTPEQDRHMQNLREAAITLMQSGEVVTAANGGVLMGKLLQVSQGFAIAEDGSHVAIPHAPRTKALLDIISKAAAKCVIFGVYKYGNAMLARELAAAGVSVEIVDGSVSGKARADALRRFQCEAEPRVLICHPTTTAYGVELSAADTMIFNGAPPLGDFIFGQALERLSSAKQRAKEIHVIRLSVTKEERKLFSALERGQKQGAFINALFEEYVKGGTNAR